MKKFIKIFIILLIIVFAGIFYLINSLDSIVKRAVISGGSKVMQTEVSLADVSLKLKSGEAEFNQFKVANPEGFKTESAISLGKIYAKIDTSSLSSDTIIIDKINIEEPVITYEIADNKGSNINVLSNNINEFSSKIKEKIGSKEDLKEEAPQETGKEKKMIIKELIVSGGKINLSTPFLEGKVTQVSLPSIKLNNLGKNEGGLSGAEIGAKVFQSIIENAVKSVVSANIINMEGLKSKIEEVEGNLKDTKGVLKGLLGN